MMFSNFVLKDELIWFFTFENYTTFIVYNFDT